MLALASFTMPLSAQEDQEGRSNRRAKVHQVKKRVAEHRARERHQEKWRPGPKHVREFLRKHPKLRKEIMAAADKNGDGKLSPEERRLAWKMLKHRHKDLMKKWIERRKERREERKQQWQEHREERKERREQFKEEHPNATKRLHRGLDRNGDGKVGPRELKRGRKIHDRLDRNHDGKVGPRERHHAKKVKKHVDLNHDGKVGPKERHHAKKVRKTVQRKKAQQQPRPRPRPQR